MHVILGTAGLDDAQKLLNLKPSAQLAGYTSVTPSFSSLGGLAMMTPRGTSCTDQGNVAVISIRRRFSSAVPWPWLLFFSTCGF